MAFEVVRHQRDDALDGVAEREADTQDARGAGLSMPQRLLAVLDLGQRLPASLVVGAPVLGEAN